MRAKNGILISEPTSGYRMADPNQKPFHLRNQPQPAPPSGDDEDDEDPVFNNKIRPPAQLINEEMKYSSSISGPSDPLSSRSTRPAPPISYHLPPEQIPLSRRSALYDIGRAYLEPDGALGTGEPSESHPEVYQPPDYEYELKSPIDPMNMAVQFDPSELPPDRRSENGAPWIVQSPEHGYALMRQLDEENRRQNGHGADGMQYMQYGPPSQENATRPWPGINDASAHWPPQRPTLQSSVSRGWQPASHPANGNAPSGTSMSSQPYYTPAGWTQPPDSSPDRSGSPSSSNPYPRPGQAAPPQGNQGPQSAPPSRQASWAQGEARPLSHPPSGGMQQWAPQPGSTNPAWPSSHSMADPPAGPPWQRHGLPPPSSHLEHRSLTDIDGRADDAMRWSSTSGNPSNPPQGWERPPSANNAPPNEGAANGAAGNYPMGEARRAPSVPIREAGNGSGSGQPSPVTWSPSATSHPPSAHPPWTTGPHGHPPGPVPPDRRLQTPGGTGAMGAHPTSQTTTVTPGHAVPGYGPPTAYPVYPGQPTVNHVQNPNPPGTYGMNREIQYGSQPDSMAAYSQGSGMAISATTHPRPPSTGPNQRYQQMTNPYPPTGPPPVTGTAPYSISRPGTAPQPQNLHQQPPPNAQANIYPNVYQMQMAHHPQTPAPGAPVSNPSYVSYPEGAPLPPGSYPLRSNLPPSMNHQRMMGPAQVGPGMATYQPMGGPPQPTQDMYAPMGGPAGYRPPQPQ
ncbi:hypothetical protein CPB86DRAFT_226184 [Serendipita vermifera]|nr:hypothetical protein CPB86DRAFT_226184 [Serendipita vermifera]